MGSIAWSMPSKKQALAKTAQGRATRQKQTGSGVLEATRSNPPAPKERRLERGIEHKPEIAAQETLALVHRCLQGDPHAWQQLVQAQHRRVYGICYRFTGCSTDAEDLTQDVFLKVYRNLEQFDLDRGSFQTWLTSLTRNLLVDHFRRSRPDRSTSSIDAGWDDPEEPQALSERLQDARPGPHEHSVNRELQNMVQQALLQVSPELREAVILRDLKDMDYKEIAVVLAIPEGTVKSRISRGRMELARLLERTKGQVM
ncbi:MAG TPA: RNA polymerase sigma factor [Acidobacteriaceae bacterium]|nr:RNA polymerase sigma factor [Acidobacteriaceae bacterium]